MKKSYYHNGETYIFTDVHMEAGMLYGRCINRDKREKWAWLDPNGFQFEGERRVEALEVPYSDMAIPHGFHYWGSELRNNAQWRKQWEKHT